MSTSNVNRIIFNGLIVFSLLLCVTTVVFWVRSYSRTDRVGFVPRYNVGVFIESGRGVIDVIKTWGINGFSRWGERPTDFTKFQLRYWPLVLLFALAPIKYLVRLCRCARRP